jgi:sialidase-1
MKRFLSCFVLLLLLAEILSAQEIAPLPYDHYFHLRHGLASVKQRITRDKAATVAFLGGSITYNPGWRDKVCAWLKERFPETRFHFIAAGIPSLGSPAHAFRLQRDVLDSGRIDLLFIETAVNDRANGTDSLTQALALEGIVRHARQNNPAMDLVMMSFADPEKSRDYEEGLVPVETQNQERIATQYQLPSINLDREVWDKIRHKEFSWEKDFKDLHPSPFGQELYAATIKALFVAAFNQPQNTDASRGLPTTLSAGNLDAGVYVSPREAKHDDDWKLDPDWAPADGLDTRPGFVHREMLTAGRPGATLHLPFSGNAAGIAIVSGSDAGKIQYSIDGGTPTTLDLFTPWSSQLHLPWYLILEKNLAGGNHVLEIKIIPEKNSSSKGNACRIVYFLVNHQSASTMQIRYQ